MRMIKSNLQKKLRQRRKISNTYIYYPKTFLIILKLKKDYKTLKNHDRKSIKHAKAQNIIKTINHSKNKTKCIWNIINNHKKAVMPNNFEDITNVTKKENIAKVPTIHSNTFNDYFLMPNISHNLNTSDNPELTIIFCRKFLLKKKCHSLFKDVIHKLVVFHYSDQFKRNVIYNSKLEEFLFNRSRSYRI